MSAADVRDALARIRVTLKALDKARWWRAALALGRMTSAGRVPAWPDVEWTVPDGGFVNRPIMVAALSEVLGGPADRVCAMDRPAGRALHAELGEPVDVLLEFTHNAPRHQLVYVAPLDGTRVIGRGCWVPLDDAALAWASPSGPMSASHASSEYNPDNDFNQQQGIACAYPLDEIRQRGRAGAAQLIAAPRRACGYLVTHAQQPTCRINGKGCASKGNADSGTGGPKVLLEPRLHRPVGVPGPGAPLAPVSSVTMLHHDSRYVLAPDWATQLRSAMGPQAVPSFRDIATVIGWLRPGADGPTASTRVLADLIGEETMLKICGP